MSQTQTKTKVIITDIEGTTSSISFVHDVLFPYSKKHLESYVLQNRDKPEIRAILLDSLHYPEHKPFTEEFFADDIQIVEAIDKLKQWITNDEKIKPLKDLQGYIWEDGYRKGDYRGHIYVDAYNKLQEWHNAGLKIFIYSSGSIKAQELIFAHTEYGDINYLFSGYFDTSIGGKKESSSYSKILQTLNDYNDDEDDYSADEIVFLSDNLAELDAASETGLQTIYIVRDPEIKENSSHQKLGDFSQIDLP